jgi:hypothetical protein
VAQLEAATPGVGDVMSGVQLHFAKLYYAARAKNWGLASFEIDEVKENLEKAAILRPFDNGVQLGEMFQGLQQKQFPAMKNAVERQDFKAFQQNYGESMSVCNMCHTATGRPFIVITLPSAPPVMNQRWEPVTEATTKEPRP